MTALITDDTDANVCDVVPLPDRWFDMLIRRYPDSIYGDASRPLTYERKDRRTSDRTRWQSVAIQIVDQVSNTVLPGFVSPVAADVVDPDRRIRAVWRPKFGTGAGELRTVDQYADYLVLWTGVDDAGNAIVAEAIPWRLQQPIVTGAPGTTPIEPPAGGSVDTRADKNLPALTTTADGDLALASAITATPAGDGYVTVVVNGAVEATLGDADKTHDCYFSGDGGASARAMANITAGDTLHWNGSIAGYQLATTDQISLHYEV